MKKLKTLLPFPGQVMSPCHAFTGEHGCLTNSKSNKMKNLTVLLMHFPCRVMRPPRLTTERGKAYEKNFTSNALRGSWS